MKKAILSYRKGSYRKLFIAISFASFFLFIYSFTIRDISSILIWLGVFLAALKQVVIPTNLDQNLFASKNHYHISDNDFINKYNNNSVVNSNSNSNSNSNKVWYKLILLCEKLSSFLLTIGILHIIFTQLKL